MAITQALCTSWKVEILTGIHNFTNGTGDAFKIALYTAAATLGASTTAYSTTDEISGTGYSAGGAALTTVTPTSSGTTAIVDFVDVSWSSATFTARGALIYNSSKANRAVGVLDFGSDKSVTGGTFTIIFPAATAADALIRIS
jgi:hypothetical protein